MLCDKCGSTIGVQTIRTHVNIEGAKKAIEAISRKHWGILSPINSFDAVNRKIYLKKYKVEGFDGKFEEYLVGVMALELKAIIGIEKHEVNG
jgi:hypothetical protein